jgi:hypothetical protein
MIAATGGAPRILKQSSPYPFDLSQPWSHDLRFYRPIAWSPDGTRLLASAAFYPEGGEYVIIPVDGSPLITLLGQPCCQATWSVDGSSVYVANDTTGLFDTGLWRVDAATGQSETLITGYSENTGQPPTETDLFQFVSSVRELSDGQLYAFLGTGKANDIATFGAPPRSILIMARLNPADVSQRTPLRTDSHLIREALWVEDASGAVIVDATSQPIDQWSPTGPLLWLKADGSPAINLNAQGNLLRWGK